MSRIFKVDENPIISEDGNASLTLIGADSSRDGGGYLYRFEILKPSYVEGPLSGFILIVDNTAFRAKEFYSRINKDFENLKFSQQMNLFREYREQFGCIFRVTELTNINFQVNVISDAQFIEIILMVSRLYLKKFSSYKENNSDENADQSGFYPDEIEFSPMGLPLKFRRVLTAREVFC